MRTYLYIDNFRGFQDEVVPISQVNFLVGENSTGKSSFLELIETFFGMQFWLFEPRYGAPGTPEKHFLDLVSASSNRKRRFTIGAIEIHPKDNSKHRGIIVDFVNLDGRPVPARVTLLRLGSMRTVDGNLWRSEREEKYRARISPLEMQGSLIVHEYVRKIAHAHRKNTKFQPQEIGIERAMQPIFMRFDSFFFDSISIEARHVEVPFPFLSSLVELAPIRSRPRRTYDTPQTAFNAEGEHVPYVIKKRLTGKRADSFRRFIENAGESSGLFRTIRLKQYGVEQRAPFEIHIVLDSTALSVESVGYGVSQALPLLVEMFDRPEQTAYALQQPEVHLHPRAQATFGDLFAVLARDEEKRFFVETHSDFTIDRFRLNIRNHGEISSQLLFFQRKAGKNCVTPIKIDSHGNLDDNQPDEYRKFFFNESLAVLG